MPGLFGRSEANKTAHEVEFEKALALKKSCEVATQPERAQGIDVAGDIEAHGLLGGGKSTVGKIGGNVKAVLPKAGGTEHGWLR